jgi:hypothetical protein
MCCKQKLNLSSCVFFTRFSSKATDYNQPKILLKSRTVKSFIDFIPLTSLDPIGKKFKQKRILFNLYPPRFHFQKMDKTYTINTT